MSEERLSARSTKLDFTTKHKTTYCIPNWLRDEQIKVAIQKVSARIERYNGLRQEPIAIVGFGPSLQNTWEEIKNYKYIISTSGAHKFLVERGIIPTWHVEVDPREHKVALLGEPHPDVTYLPSATCHPKYWDHLKNNKVLLWHVFATEEDALRTLPYGDWALLGGPDVGQRALTIARFFGFTDMHGFGFDGCANATDNSHAADHPNAPKKFLDCEYPAGSGKIWKTTPSLLECAKSFPHELNQLKDVTLTIHGDTLIAEILKTYVRQSTEKDGIIAVYKPLVISKEYQDLNKQLHESNLSYGVGGGRWADVVVKLVNILKKNSPTIPAVLDYGCGKGYLAKALPFPIWEYDPAVPGKDESPRAAEIVTCLDVLEHIEPEMLEAVLFDLARCTKQLGFFVIHMGASSKSLADGRNAHLIQQDQAWWTNQLMKHFNIGSIREQGLLLLVVVSPKKRVQLSSQVAAMAQEKL